MKEFFAAPESFLPVLLTAFAAQPESATAAPLAPASHFLINEAFAAPASGLPFLLMALDAQSDATGVDGAPVAAGAGIAGVTAVATCANNIPATSKLLKVKGINLDKAVVSY